MTKNDAWFVGTIAIACFICGVATVEHEIMNSIEKEKSLKLVFYRDNVRISLDKKP